MAALKFSTNLHNFFSCSCRYLMLSSTNYLPDYTKTNNSFENETHFGFETVKESEKAEKVHEVFETVATSYDRMNDVMSMGVHRIWKDIFIQRLGPTPRTRLLDVAGGTVSGPATCCIDIGLHGIYEDTDGGQLCNIHTYSHTEVLMPHFCPLQPEEEQWNKCYCLYSAHCNTHNILDPVDPKPRLPLPGPEPMEVDRLRPKSTCSWRRHTDAEHGTFLDTVSSLQAAILPPFKLPPQN